MRWQSYSNYEGAVVNRQVRVPANKFLAGLGPFPNTMSLPPGLRGLLRTVLDGSDVPAEINNPASLPLHLAGMVEFSKDQNNDGWKNINPSPRGDTLTVVIIRKQMEQMEIFAE
jgi:hypothetical protein